ncbi:hypothetical protein N431DRAFT_481150 [Stipitochalara longipes BDJ]|nr:hypothetical protein N431DRAFT_481150 [Stipitochalara longipes BDJ]
MRFTISMIAIMALVTGIAGLAIPQPESASVAREALPIVDPGVDGCFDDEPQKC